MKVFGAFAALVVAVSACRSTGLAVEDLRIWRPAEACALQVPSPAADTLLVGIVVDRETNCPLPRARVELPGNGLLATTDEQGIFRLGLPSGGAHQLQVVKLCWQRRTLTVQGPSAEPLVLPLERALCTI